MKLNLDDAIVAAKAVLRRDYMETTVTQQKVLVNGAWTDKTVTQLTFIGENTLEAMADALIESIIHSVQVGLNKVGFTLDPIGNKEG